MLPQAKDIFFNSQFRARNARLSCSVLTLQSPLCEERVEMPLRLKLTTHQFLDAGVILLNVAGVPPVIPLSTDPLCLDKSGTTWRPHFGSFSWSFEYLQVQAGSGVRSDVAVHLLFDGSLVSLPEFELQTRMNPNRGDACQNLVSSLH